jgi:hypothetical protein
VGNRSLAAAPLAKAELTRPLGIIHRRGKILTPTIARFLDLVRQAGDQPPPAGFEKPNCRYQRHSPWCAKLIGNPANGGAIWQAGILVARLPDCR